MKDKIASKIIYEGQVLSDIIPGGPKLGTKERKKWLMGRAAYQQLPKKIIEDYPLKQVSKALKSAFCHNKRNKQISVRVGECESNYERICVTIPINSMVIFWNNSVRNVINKSGFYLAYVDQYKSGKIIMMLCRSSSFSRLSK